MSAELRFGRHHARRHKQGITQHASQVSQRKALINRTLLNRTRGEGVALPADDFIVKPLKSIVKNGQRATYYRGILVSFSVSWLC